MISVFLALSFDRFLPLLQTAGDSRSVFVFPSCVLFRRLFSPARKRPAEILVAFLPARNMFRLLGPARTVVPFFLLLLPFAFLRFTVGRVNELLMCILPHGLSDASV